MVRSYSKTASTVPPLDLVPKLDLDLRARRKIHVQPRTELNQADAVAARDGVACRHPGHDAPGQDAGDQAHPDLHSGRLGGFEPDQHILVATRGFGPHGVEKLACGVFEKGHGSAHRRVLHMHIQHGKKHRDAPAFAPNELRLGHRVDTSILPCPGETRSLAPAGTRGLGSRKKYSVNSANRSQAMIRRMEKATIAEPTSVARNPATGTSKRGPASRATS